ncbi:hypothetical protein CASFOL_016512 [Castilleja foliolosa]|uniref:DYW domain-containing protein n=1 Tax=Castilleja foliolosa TaxID=1961234 RepID=A0ABD3DCJ7_9LAMI
MITALTSLLTKPCLLHLTLSRQLSRYIHPISAAPPSPDLYFSNHFINMNAKRGQLELAHQLFDKMPDKNIFSWTILISGYSHHGKSAQCSQLFSQMLSHHRPNDFAYASVLSVCDHRHGLQVHTFALKTGFDSWIYVANALVSMYWKKNIHDAGFEAWRVFHAMDSRNLITYNSMISGLGTHGQCDKALTLFISMQRDGIEFDRTTLLTLVSSLCGRPNDGFMCFLQLHCLCIKTGLSLDVGVKTALIKGYSISAKEFNACRKLFLETNSKDRDVILWTEIMTVSAEWDPQQALILFNQMRKDDLRPDHYVFSVLIKACANLVMEQAVSAVYCRVIIAGFDNVLELSNVLIHGYARCGSIHNAERVFDEMPKRDIVSWNSILKAYAVHGKAEEALGFFRRMDVAPDETTLVAILSSCSHAGMIKEGITIFDSMENKYGILPKLDHYACMVDILGRAGHLSEAEKIIRQMPMEPDHVIWSAFLGACRKHGDANLTEFASLKLKELDPENSLGYVLVSNIYCSNNSFNEGGFIRMKMNEIGVKKEPGLSWTEIGNRVHEFASGGQRHPQIKEILQNMEVLLQQLKKIGYVPETNLVLFDVEEEHKEEQLYHHSEKLALVFALMNASDSNRVIKIIKNIRICLDCHNFMRLASKFVGKVIVVRDANRFHHFKEGECSCNDYW